MKTTLAAIVLTVSFVYSPALYADFIRGDWNGDGEATWADVHAGLRFIFIDLGESELLCGDAADVNDDGGLNIRDPLGLMNYLAFEDEEPPAAPFPAPGSDGTADTPPPESHLGPLDANWPCGDETTEPIDDPVASIRVLDAVAEGGSVRTATIVVAITNSRSFAGYQASLDAGDLFESGQTAIFNREELAGQDGNIRVFDLSNTYLHGFIGAKTKGSELRFSYLSSLGAQVFGPDGEEQFVLEIELCLREGTPAGEYPLEMIVGEIADYETGRAVVPELIGGTLTVVNDVGSEECAIEPKLPFEKPDFDVEFALGSGEAAPGESVVIPFTIETTGLTQGFSFSIDFDEEVLEATEVEIVYERQDGEDFVWEHGVLANNLNNIPGNTVREEGYAVGTVRISAPFDTVNVIPIGDPQTVVNLHFRVRPGASEQTTEIRFVDGSPRCPHPDPSEWGCHTDNMIRSRGFHVPPELLDSFIFVNGFLNIVGEVTTFRRGDTNGDAEVNVADAMFLLNHLFSSGQRPICMNAADVNDSGAVNISSGIYLLNYLFSDGPAPRPPFESCGEDPTPENSLGCFGSPECAPPVEED